MTDEIDIRVDQLDHACIPFNQTDTTIKCRLREMAVRKLRTSQAIVEVTVHSSVKQSAVSSIDLDPRRKESHFLLG